MKKFAILGAIFLGLVVIGSLGRNDASPEIERPDFTGEPIEEIPADQGAANSRSGEGSSSSDNWRTYINEEAGYKIIFPETWKGFRLERNVITGKEGLPNVQTGFGGWKPNAYYLFSLFEESKDTYRETLKLDTGKTFKIIYVGESQDGKNAILCYGVCCEGGSGIDRYSSFESARCAEVPDILGTFQNVN